jgi:phenylacetate-CoA ligase
MNFLDIESIYPHLPIFAQNALCYGYGLKEARVRFGKAFRRKLEELTLSEHWSEGCIESYQDEKIRELIEYAYENVPYYHNLMNSLKLVPADIRGRKNLYKLPVLTKEDVRQNFDGLVSKKINKRRLILKHTSGTTGKSLHFYMQPSAVAFQWAICWRHRMRFGVERSDWHANFTGKLVVPPAQTKPPYWRWASSMQQALINMHHITPSKIKDIICFLNRYNFKFYTGYPSIIHTLAVTGKDAGLTINSPPRFVFTGAENILDYQRQDIQDYLGSILTDTYGCTEACGGASQCPEFVYHEDFEFGIMECVDPSPADKNGRIKGKIVCTGFANPAFPFIRYEVGDIGIWEDAAKMCRCGRKARMLVNVEGRIDDYVITPENRKIMRFDYIFKGTKNVKEAQIVQEKLGAVKVRIVRRPQFGVQDEDDISRQIAKWISPKLEVTFEYVNEIERGNSGKFSAVVSKIKRDAL